MFEEHPSPVVARAEAARKLPRMALLALLFAFIVPGIITRDFWGSKELINFALTLSMTQGSIIDWVLPNIDGVAFYETGPLPAWVAALCVKLFGWLIGTEAAARISTLFWFTLATASIWYGTWYLARRNEAQPVALAFGGQASPKDFGRVVADGALLLFVSTFGLFIPLRELNVDTALLATISAYFFSLSYSLHRPTLGPIFTGAVTALSVWVADFATGLTLLILAIFVHVRLHSFETTLVSRISSIIIVASGVFFLWPIMAVGFAIETVDAWFDGWWQAQINLLRVIEPIQIENASRDFLWFLWPLWPFACFSLYAFRKQLNRTHIKLPLTMSVIFFITNFFVEISGTRFLMVLTPSMCVLAAFGLLSAHRSWSNFLDWFSASVFTLAISTLWAYYFAWQTEFPPKMFKSIMNLAPGVEAPFHGLVFVLTFGITLFWITLVLWRMNRHTIVAWKGPWLAAVGMSTLAVLCVYLFGPAIDKARSYQPVVAQAIEDYQSYKTVDSCLGSETLTPVQKVIFVFYGLPLSEQKSRCDFHFENSSLVASTKAYKPTSKVIDTYSRPRDRERFILLRD